MAKVLFTWFTKLTLPKFGLKLMLPQALEKKFQMIFMLMFTGTEQKYIIQVHKHKVIYILPHKNYSLTSRRLMGHYAVLLAIQRTF